MSTKGDNLEYYALLVLQKYIGLNIKNIKKREFPDWEVGEQGIEVTRAILASDQKFLSWFNKNKNKSEEEIKRINKNPDIFLFFVDNKLRGGAAGGLTSSSFYVMRCKQVFFEKIKKLNCNYELFNINSLFILTDSIVNSKDIGEVFSYIIKKSSEFEHKFNYVYLFTHENFYIFDIFLKTEKSIIIDGENLLEFKNEYNKYLKEKNEKEKNKKYNNKKQN